MTMASSSMHQLSFAGHPLLPRNSRVQPRPQFSSVRFPSFSVRASSVLAVEPDTGTQKDQTLEVEIFSCPICYEPLIRRGPSGLNLEAVYRSGFKCKNCNKSYSSKNNFLDLTLTAGLRDYVEVKPARSELFSYFQLVGVENRVRENESTLHMANGDNRVLSIIGSRSPLVSFLYERGWRQSFNGSGFPGQDEEFKMAQEYFRPAESGLLVDVSCGSGLFSRKFAKSGTYSGVIALDYSENMLRQCYDFIKQDDAILKANLALVRADVSRLPFSSGSVDAVHAGAALHCWPSPSNAIAEITRVLRSGGVFVGTTFLQYTPSTPWILLPFSQRASQNYDFLTAEEIEDLCTSCGLTNYTSKIQQSFIMFSAQKP